MNFEVVATQNFTKRLKRLAKKYRSIREDLIPVIEQLETQPLLGKAIGNDCFKTRVGIAGKSKGKSAGARLITFVRVVKNRIYLVDIYDKSEQSNIEEKELIKFIQTLPRE